MKIKLINTHGTTDRENMKTIHGVNGDYTVSWGLNTEMEWEEFILFYGDVENWDKYENKHEIPMLIPGELINDGGRKTNSNIKSRCALIFDIDDVPQSKEEVIEFFKDYEFFMYSSSSNGIKKGLNCRIILPFGYDVSAEEWNKRLPNLKAMYNKNSVIPFDSSAFTLSQGQCKPALITGTKPFTYHNKGSLFDFMAIEETLSIAAIVNNTVFTGAKFTNEEHLQLALDITSHCANSMGHNDRLLLAGALKAIDMNDFDIIQILASVRLGSSTGNDADIVKSAKPLYNSNLYKYVAKGTRIPAMERRKVVFTDVVVKNENKYTKEWVLEKNEYISDIFHDMDFTSGVNLLIADVGTGKSTQFMKKNNNGAKDGYIFLAPLTSIVTSFGGDNSTRGSGIATWNQIESIINEKDRSKFNNLTLVIDECHGLYADYGYKARTINRLISMFECFKSVILMSGTVEKDYFSSITFNNVYRVKKPSIAKKTIRTVFCKNKDDVVLDHINSLPKGEKVIVLANNKKYGKAIKSKINRNCIIINADVKDEFETVEFFKNRSMEKYDVLVGTNSIVEGYSIEDELDVAHVVIWGDVSPERIEQFTNRYRDVRVLKDVWYFVDRRKVESIDEFRRDNIIDEVKALCESLQSVYESISNDTIRKSFIRQYAGDFAKDLLYFHEGKFCVSSTAIDYEYSEHREKQYRNSFDMFAGRLNDFGFDVLYPLVVDGDEMNSQEIADEMKAIAQGEMKEREELLVQLKKDIESNCVVLDSNSNDVYNHTYESIQKLIIRGMDKNQVSELIDGYIIDESYMFKAHQDADYVATGETIRELVINSVMGKKELSTNEIKDVADEIVSKVAMEYGNNVNQLLKTKSWGGVITVENGLVISKSAKAAKEILMKYIKLGKSKVVSRNGTKIRVAPIDALSLTGIRFNKLDLTGLISQISKKQSKTFVQMVEECFEVSKGMSPQERGQYSRSIISENMSEEDKAMFIACRKFGLFRTMTAKEIVDSLDMK